MTGFPRVGKTTIGQQLPQKPFFDLDQLMEEFYEESIRALWKKYGTKMHAMEFHCLEKLQGKKGVLALGGGTILDQKNRQILQTLGKILYLYLPKEAIYRRLQKKSFPLSLPENNFDSMFTLRDALYREVSFHVLNIVDLTVEDIIDGLKSLW